MKEDMRGAFIVVEGGDGAGKTTQLTLLDQWLGERGIVTETSREPGGTAVGERIRSLLLEHGQGQIDPRTEALLFAASRAAHVTQRIVPALRAGRFVLCDRYIDSSVAYQGVGRQLGAEAVTCLNDWATEGLQPDLTIVLDLDPRTGRERRSGRDGGPDRIESSDDDFHTRLREAFLDRADADPQRYLVVDAARPAEVVQQAVRSRLEPLLTSRAGGRW